MITPPISEKLTLATDYTSRMTILFLSILGNLVKILCSRLEVLGFDALLEGLGVYHG